MNEKNNKIYFLPNDKTTNNNNNLESKHSLVDCEIKRAYVRLKKKMFSLKMWSGK